MSFDRDQFVQECREASAEADPVAAVRDVVHKAIAHASEIDATLGTPWSMATSLLSMKAAPETWLSSVELTIQRIPWSPGAYGSPHEHRMWAVVGVYAGSEINRFFASTVDGLEARGQRVVCEGEVVALRPDVIHSVTNPGRDWTVGLHVYGGDLLGIERNAWGPDGRAVPFATNLNARIGIWQVAHDLAEERALPIDDERRFLLNRALDAACVKLGRYPDSAETRQIAAEAWQLEP